MENENAPVKPIALNHGLYYAIFSIAVVVILYALKMQQNLAIGIINVLGTVGIFVLAIIAYKKSNDDQLTLGQAIKVGLATAAIGGLIVAIYTYIHYTYLQPEFIEAIREKALEDMYRQNPDLTSEQVESAQGMMNIFTSAGFIGTVSIIGSLIYGLVVSLIAGLVLKSE
ncbi:DUF4199 domain-containing protein [Olleya sp. R77988]|uniref:DUF4199 domain-containing protein n=1 Tax=Olleya sp. R77988 TaxID=3093875 RepID=UPI0037C75701